MKNNSTVYMHLAPNGTWIMDERIYIQPNNPRIHWLTRPCAACKIFSHTTESLWFSPAFELLKNSSACIFKRRVCACAKCMHAFHIDDHKNLANRKTRQTLHMTRFLYLQEYEGSPSAFLKRSSPRIVVFLPSRVYSPREKKTVVSENRG